MNRGQRILFGALLGLGLGGCAFALAAVVAGRCCVPEGSGMAGPAFVLGYGVLGGVVGLLAGMLLAALLRPRVLVTCTVLAGIGGAVVYGGLIAAYIYARAETRDHLQHAYERLPEFRLRLAHTRAAGVTPFRTFAADWGERGYEVTTGSRACRADLPGAQAVELLAALREVELVMLDDPFPCAGTLGKVQHELEFFVPAPTSPDAGGKILITGACLQRYAALQAPIEAAARLHAENGWPDGC